MYFDHICRMNTEYSMVAAKWYIQVYIAYMSGFATQNGEMSG